MQLGGDVLQVPEGLRQAVHVAGHLLHLQHLQLQRVLGAGGGRKKGLSRLGQEFSLKKAGAAKSEKKWGKRSKNDFQKSQNEFQRQHGGMLTQGVR